MKIFKQGRAAGVDGVDGIENAQEYQVYAILTNSLTHWTT